MSQELPPRPEYQQQFAEPPSEAYERGVRDGVAWAVQIVQLAGIGATMDEDREPPA